MSIQSSNSLKKLINQFIIHNCKYSSELRLIYTKNFKKNAVQFFIMTVIKVVVKIFKRLEKKFRELITVKFKQKL